MIKGLKDLEGDACTLVQGDITKEETLRAAMPGVSAVVVCVGARSATVNGRTVHQKPSEIEGPGMKNVVNAIKSFNMPDSPTAICVIMVSCWGVTKP